jgi:RNA polymerase sigma-70 factor (ECF subfamily)
MDYAAFDDDGLIRLIAHADAGALAAFYDRYSRLVFGLALNTVGDRATAEEVTQDVFMRVWERAVQYRSEQARVSTWLTSIARNRAIDMLRRRGVRAESHSVAWDDLAPGAEPSAGGPEEEAGLALERDRVRAALAGLPGEQKEVLALAYFKGYTQSEIAAALGQPLGTVKTRMRRGMQKLREALNDE